MFKGHYTSIVEQGKKAFSSQPLALRNTEAVLALRLRSGCHQSNFIDTSPVCQLDRVGHGSEVQARIAFDEHSPLRSSLENPLQPLLETGFLDRFLIQLDRPIFFENDDYSSRIGTGVSMGWRGFGGTNASSPCGVNGVITIDNDDQD